MVVLVILAVVQAEVAGLVVQDLTLVRQLELLQTQAEMVDLDYIMILAVHLQLMQVVVVVEHLQELPLAQVELVAVVQPAQAMLMEHLAQQVLVVEVEAQVEVLQANELVAQVEVVLL